MLGDGPHRLHHRRDRSCRCDVGCGGSGHETKGSHPYRLGPEGRPVVQGGGVRVVAVHGSHVCGGRRKGPRLVRPGTFC